MPAHALKRFLTPHPDPAPAAAFAADLRRALSSRPKAISPKWFYDEAGSDLFERICDLPEYYPTRTELALMRDHAGEMAAAMGHDVQLVEYGAGSLRKVRLLLKALRDPRMMVPVDISGDHLEAAAAGLRLDHPGLDVVPVVADYTRPHRLPACPPGARRVGFFPGSTLGNFSPEEALAFLHMAAAELRGGGMLIGVDLVKDPTVLHAAYNDSQGVTAAFNLNLLARANREVGADFDLQAFAHRAFYNAPLQRIEMHVESRRRQSVTFGGRSYVFDPGETLHTENSYKYTVDGLRQLAAQAGFEPGPAWLDSNRWFSVHWLALPA